MIYFAITFFINIFVQNIVFMNCKECYDAKIKFNKHMFKQFYIFSIIHESVLRAFNMCCKKLQDNSIT